MLIHCGINNNSSHSSTSEYKNKFIFLLFPLFLIILKAQAFGFNSLSTKYGLSQNSIPTIFQDNYNFLRLGTSNGLNRYDGQKFKIYNSIQAEIISIKKHDFYNIAEDKDINLWNASYSGGLIKYVRSSDSFTRYAKDKKNPNSNPGNRILALLIDKKNNLWIQTESGLSKFASFIKTFTDFSTDDALQSNGFYTTANTKSQRTGELLSDQGEGFHVFNQVKISNDIYKPDIVITDFSINNQLVEVNKEYDGRIILTKNISETKKIYLNYNQNNISFEFASLSFASSLNNEHEYKMEGLDNRWINIGHRKFVSFTNLAPGEYTFKVKAVNNSGIGEDNIASIRIIIHPPFWGTFPFRVLFVIVLIGIIFSIFRYKTRSIQKRSIELQNEVDKRTEELIKINRQLQNEVTVRIKTEEKLLASKNVAEEASRSKSEFLSNMSHELRTPLNAILGYTQILLKQDNITQAQKEQLLTILRSGEYLLNLINDILNLRRMESHREEVNKSEFNLHSLINEVVDTVQIKAVEKNLAFYVDETLPKPTTVIGDSKKIKQILLNLLGNAVKYTEKGWVKFEIKKTDEHPSITEGNKIKFLFSVSDSGIGIAKEKFEDIFQPFTPKDKSNEGIESTGLGLAITKRLVDLLEGNLSFKSELGIGSVFSIELNLQTAVSKKETMTFVEEIITGYKGNRKSILIVDDNATNLSMLASLLQPVGFEIIKASNGKEALEKIKNTIPDLILLDLLMPLLNGQEFLNRIRNMNSLKQIKIIGISAAVADKKSLDEFSANCDAFISKPVDTSLLLNKIRTLLNIEWIKDSESLESVKNSTDKSIKITPPEEVIVEIIQTVNLGDYNKLENILKRLESDSDSYKTFCDEIRTHAKSFNEDEIIRLCHQ